MDYVVGLVFDPSMRSVLLIHKTHPNWQRGRMNGPGGKLKKGELAVDAMWREFKQETGLSISTSNWNHVITITGYNQGVYKVHYFAAHENITAAKSMTEEPIEVWKFGNAFILPSNLMDDLYWIIPMLVRESDVIDFPVFVQRRAPDVNHGVER